MQEDADMADWEEAAGISAPLYEIVGHCVRAPIPRLLQASGEN